MAHDNASDTYESIENLIGTGMGTIRLPETGVLTTSMAELVTIRLMAELVTML